MKIKNPFRYSGEYFDLSSGYYYLRARYFAPETGRFITEDSYTGEISDPLSLNLYSYCGQDPVNNVDASGHAKEWLFALSHPFIANDIGSVGVGNNNISTYASNFSINLKLQEHKKPKDEYGEGSETNAFRHALWVSTMKNKYGSAIADFAARCHEDNPDALKDVHTDYEYKTKVFPDWHKADEGVDISNNFISTAEIFANGSTNMKLISEDILKFFKNYGFSVVKKHGSKDFRMERKRISQKQYLKSTAILKKLGENGLYK